MCIDISNNRLASSHCFNLLEKADKRVASLGGCCRYPMQAITRLFLLIVIPLAIAVDVTYTSLATLSIVLIPCFGGKQHLKNTATAWMLLPLTPVIVLLYLIRGEIGNNALFTIRKPSMIPWYRQTALEDRQDKERLHGHSSRRLGDLPDLPVFSLPSDFPRTPLCQAIVRHDWHAARRIIVNASEEEQNNLIAGGIRIIWDDGEGSATYVVSLMEFMMLMTPTHEGFLQDLSDPSFLEVSAEIYSLLQKTQKLGKAFSDHPRLTPVLEKFMKIFINSCNEGRGFGSVVEPLIHRYLYRTTFLWALTLYDLKFSDRADPSMLPLLSKSYQQMDNPPFDASFEEIKDLIAGLHRRCREQISKELTSLLGPHVIPDLAKIIAEYTFDTLPASTLI